MAGELYGIILITVLVLLLGIITGIAANAESWSDRHSAQPR